MQKPSSLFLATTMIFLLLGCSDGPNTGTSPQDLQGRYTAAEQISDGSKRNTAFAAVAETAGKAGDGEVARKAVEQIDVASLRNSTADSVAVALAKGGHSDAATKVAMLMTDGDLRNATMEKIAKAGQ